MNTRADAARLTTDGTIPSHGLFIDGSEVAASNADLLDVLNPTTGEVMTPPLASGRSPPLGPASWPRYAGLPLTCHPVPDIA